MKGLEIISICTGYRDCNKNIVKCEKIKVNGNWETEGDVMENYPDIYQKYLKGREKIENYRLSHGCCPDCLKKTLENI